MIAVGVEPHSRVGAPWNWLAVVRAARASGDALTRWWNCRERLALDARRAHRLWILWTRGARRWLIRRLVTVHGSLWILWRRGARRWLIRRLVTVHGTRSHQQEGHEEPHCPRRAK